MNIYDGVADIDRYIEEVQAVKQILLARLNDGRLGRLAAADRTMIAAICAEPFDEALAELQRLRQDATPQITTAPHRVH